MNSWALATNSVSNALTGSALAFSTSNGILDPYYLKVLGSQKELLSKIANTDHSSDSIESFILAACIDNIIDIQKLIIDHPEYIDDLSTGITPLIYSIVLHKVNVIEFLLDNSANVDLNDTSVANYTPLMWAIHLDQLDTVKTLLNHQADPYLSPKDDGKDAISLVFPENVIMYEYFKTHNLLGKSKSVTGDDFYQSFEPQGGVEIDDLNNKIRMQTITSSYQDGEDEEDEEDAKIQLYVEERTLSEDPYLFALNEFDYTKLRPEQYIKFTDSDIPSLLDYIFNYRTSSTSNQHNTKIPSSIIFQLLRYSHMKAESQELTEFLFDCFITRLRSVTNTKSGVMTSEVQQSASGGAGGDIVLLSYWLSVIQFLHFYLSKNDFYKSYPKFLQELINIVQSLIAGLSFAVNTRLGQLIDECLLDFTNLVDVSNALYAKDWNLFKSKKKHPNTYDDIFNMLYPPSERELMKPSPLRIVQVLGALDYVLKLHEVNTLNRFQAFSQVFYGINCNIFNKLISLSKYCSRGKAIQIRLNISSLEDWLRSHNYKIYKPDKIGQLNNLLPPDFSPLTNILIENSTNKNDAHTLSFYYKSLYHVGRSQLQPTFELLQWLQCMSSLSDEENLIGTINQFDYLNYFQIVKTMTKLYKYEVSESKIPKGLINYMKRLQNEQGEKQVEKSLLHYMTQINFLLKEIYIYLNPNYIFAVSLPNLQELINSYGSGIGGVRIYRAKKFQPSLPLLVMDDIDELLAKNKADSNETFEHEEEDEDEETEEKDDDNDNDRVETFENPSKSDTNNDKSNEKIFKGDQLFKEVQLPGSLAHKHWGSDDIDSNPWT